MIISSQEASGNHLENSPVLIAFGNPLLDISIQISDESILHDFDLNHDDQGEISIEKLQKIILEVKKRYGQPKYNPGGSALNTIKILNKLGEKNTLFCGAIGNDENGQRLSSIYAQYELKTNLQILEKYSTGTCVCLINGAHRSLYANIGAALHFGKDLFILPDISYQQTIFYIEGYFVSEKIDVCRHIFENYCQTSSSILATNLNASYILETYGDDMKFLVQSSTLVFGNRKEFETLALIYNCDDIDHLAEHLVRFCKAERRHTKKVLVITDSNQPILVFHGDETSFQKCIFQVPEIQVNTIVDTTGAGDSFVAGFLYKYIHQKSLVECVSFGNEISGRVIKTIGCNLPDSGYNSTCRII